MRRLLRITLLAALAVCSVARADEDRTALIEKAAQALIEHGAQLLDANYDKLAVSSAPWDINDPTKTDYLSPAANNPRVAALAASLGLPLERIFVDSLGKWPWPTEGVADGRNVMISAAFLAKSNDLEAAYTLAHEYAHNLNRHLVRYTVAAYRAQLAQCSTCTDPRDLWATASAGFANQELLSLDEVRKQLELEADEWAVRRMLASGYHITDASSLMGYWERLPPQAEGYERETHPSDRTRADAINAVLAQVAQGKL